MTALPPHPNHDAPDRAAFRDPGRHPDGAALGVGFLPVGTAGAAGPPSPLFSGSGAGGARYDAETNSVTVPLGCRTFSFGRLRPECPHGLFVELTPAEAQEIAAQLTGGMRGGDPRP